MKKKKKEKIVYRYSKTKPDNKLLPARLTTTSLTITRATQRSAVGVIVLLKLKQTNPNQGISSSQANLANQTHVNLSHTRSTNRVREPNTRCSRGNFSKRTLFTLRVRRVRTIVLVRPAVAVLLVVGDGEVDRRHSGSRIVVCGVLLVCGVGCVWIEGGI
jgi:hypothetical protein